MEKAASKHSRSSIIIVAAFEAGRGGGHLCRCAALTCDLRALGRDAWLYLQGSFLQGGADRLLPKDFKPEWRVTENDFQRFNEGVECIVLDRFQTPPEELERWKKIAPVIGLDEGGPCRSGFDFLVDILVPQKLAKPPANISSPSLLKFPAKEQLKKSPAGNGEVKVLVSFGQEDSAGLGALVANALSTQSNNGDMEITLLQGGLGKTTANAPSSLKTLETIPELAKHLSQYDLVITHYGITAYEALYAGAAVLLINPSRYHERLSRAAGFITFASHGGTKAQRKYSINTSVPSNQRFGAFVRGKTRTKLKEHCKALAARHGLDREGAGLAALINSFSPKVSCRCPVCGDTRPAKGIARFSERTYRRCERCGVIFMDRTGSPPIEYEREYFFEKYAEQYGKTYIEDFDNIKAAGKRRLRIIRKLQGEKGGALLDVGCAYGPFLAAAREEGFSPYGIDPAEDAVRYVQNELKLPAACGFFPLSTSHDPLLTTHYSAVTLWYVVEHFRDCATVFAEVHKLLKGGGILAFSTPSFAGISGRKSRRGFLQESPADHWTVWSPGTCRKALALAGFKVKKIVSCGHHPERFPLIGKFAVSRKSPLYWALLAVSKLFALGDSFEVYATSV